MKSQTLTKLDRNGSRHPRSFSPREDYRNPIKRILVWIVTTLLLTGILAFTVLLVWAFESRNMPALDIWHTASLSTEFTARDATSKSSLQDYLDREERLFSELEEKVYDRVESTDGLKFCRYLTGGPQNSGGWETNWNRTFELVPEHIQGGALLLHGLTDSPYSLRRIGKILHAKGFYVLGLRLPAHGTIPGALTKVRWEDWVAASRIGARHVHERIGSNQPFVIAGYSNGGALAVKYSLDALSDPDLPSPDRLLLFSPEIGISPLALISNSHKLLSFLPYFAKFKWLSIRPEYDPFKYNSFPKNAAQQAHDITEVLNRQVEDVRAAGRFAGFPTVLTFLSWIDDTVDTSATIHRLYDRLENEGSELVVFDVNCFDQLAPFLPTADRAPLVRFEARSDLPYRLTVITNAARSSERMTRRTKAPRSSAIDSTALNVAWPPGVYSLTHVAVPFSPEDPVYGANENVNHFYHGLPLGRMQPRGETHLLTAPLSQLMRLRYNPFFGYLEQRVVMEIDHTMGRDKRENP
jgi:alpha-beta hydrolase superfamily lysophospholipase